MGGSYFLFHLVVDVDDGHDECIKQKQPQDVGNGDARQDGAVDFSHLVGEEEGGHNSQKTDSNAKESKPRVACIHTFDSNVEKFIEGAIVGHL